MVICFEENIYGVLLCLVYDVEEMVLWLLMVYMKDGEERGRCVFVICFWWKEEEDHGDMNVEFEGDDGGLVDGEWWYDLKFWLWKGGKKMMFMVDDGINEGFLIVYEWRIMEEGIFSSRIIFVLCENCTPFLY